MQICSQSGVLAEQNRCCKVKLLMPGIQASKGPECDGELMRLEVFQHGRTGIANDFQCLRLAAHTCRGQSPNHVLQHDRRSILSDTLWSGHRLGEGASQCKQQPSTRTEFGRCKGPSYHRQVSRSELLHMLEHMVRSSLKERTVCNLHLSKAPEQVAQLELLEKTQCALSQVSNGIHHLFIVDLKPATSPGNCGKAPGVGAGILEVTRTVACINLLLHAGVQQNHALVRKEGGKPLILHCHACQPVQRGAQVDEVHLVVLCLNHVQQSDDCMHAVVHIHAADLAVKLHVECDTLTSLGVLACSHCVVTQEQKAE
mmetsp:Transcript_69660/g.167193  ORF Transcript_69660/g.167193 Transcript_69660/m.167193 type:complete len:314 (-) Transcript_69660:171-1112(-)